MKQLEEDIFSIHRTGGRKSAYDFDEIKKMNAGPAGGTKKGNTVKVDVFNTESLQHMKNLQNKFFKS